MFRVLIALVLLAVLAPTASAKYLHVADAQSVAEDLAYSVDSHASIPITGWVDDCHHGRSGRFVFCDWHEAAASCEANCDSITKVFVYWRHDKIVAVSLDLFHMQLAEYPVRWRW